MKQNILVVDDDPAIRFALKGYLEKSGYSAWEAADLSEARKAISMRYINAILLDLNLPDGNSLDWIPICKQENPEISILVITGRGDIPLAVNAMRQGADYFATKPINMNELMVVLEKCLEIGSLRRASGSKTRRRKTTEPFFGNSTAMQQCLKEAKMAAASESPILIQGETGSGKGVLAAWIHENSARANNAFVDINCAMLQGEMLASELFGHARGAFTGAVDQKQGLLEAADEGTVFLDEIGETDPTIQGQLLKVLETKTFRRLGEVRDRDSDFRLICATNKDLQTHVSKGRFRDDLYYRVTVFTIHIPPLRERLEDLPAMCEHILKSQNPRKVEISDEAMEILCDYSWPGNIRELKNVLERAVLVSQGEEITESHLPFHLKPSLDTKRFAPIEEEIVDMEASHLRELITRCQGNVTKAAKVLGVSRSTLYRRLWQLKLIDKKPTD